MFLSLFLIFLSMSLCQEPVLISAPACNETHPILNETTQVCEPCKTDLQCEKLNITCEKNEKTTCLETGSCACVEKPGLIGAITGALEKAGISPTVVYVLIGLILLWILSTVAVKLVKFGILILIALLQSRFFLDSYHRK